MDDSPNFLGAIFPAAVALVIIVTTVTFILPAMTTMISVSQDMSMGNLYHMDETQTTYQENKNSTQMEKYMWFKQTAAELDGKLADLTNYDQELNDLRVEYGGYNVTSWLPIDREHYYQWTDERLKLKNDFNGQASNYNARMAEANWAYCNKGAMPQGLEGYAVLPKEYRAYIIGATPVP